MGTELKEKNFIQEKYSKHPLRIWVWMLILIVFTLIVLGLAKMGTQKKIKEQQIGSTGQGKKISQNSLDL